MRRTFLLLFAAAALCGCQQRDAFCITGSIAGTADAKDVSLGCRVVGGGVCGTVRLFCLKPADQEREAHRISLDRNYSLAGA